jgi:hypothetical protein
MAAAVLGSVRVHHRANGGGGWGTFVVIMAGFAQI